MLLIETQTGNRKFNAASRLAVLDRLEEKGLIPFIRNGRKQQFERISTLSPRGIEQALSESSQNDAVSPYVKGDVFWFDDYALFMIFGDEDMPGPGIEAGIAYLPECFEPARKLDVFCRNIQEALEAASVAEGGPFEDDLIHWKRTVSRAFENFAELKSGLPGAEAPQREGGLERTRMAIVLDDPAVRRFLQHIRDAYAEGRVVELLARTGTDTATGPLIRKLGDAGLVRLEILVSCRKKGRALFRLPSSDALTQITASNAVCSECGAKLADEKFDELVIPTPQAAGLLEGGAWLTARLHTALNRLGLSDDKMLFLAATGEGASYVLGNMLDELFLFALFDGDVTVNEMRNLLARVGATYSSHVFVIATGRVHDDARSKLAQYSKQRAAHESALGATIVEGTEDFEDQIREVFSRSSEKALARELYPLDLNLGFSAARLMSIRFKADIPLSTATPVATRSLVEPVSSGFDNF
jgi:hypothetical protein